MGMAKPRRAVAPPPAADEREHRGARRKRETRDKLLRAAFRLIAERGIDAIAINEITEAADVGFGSFYNHFESKDAVYEAVYQAVFDDFGDALTRLTEDVEDAAEVVAVCVRHAIGRARREPLWGRFLVREGQRAHALSRGLGARLLRDIKRGITQKRFHVTDPLMAFIGAAGIVMGAILTEVEYGGAALPKELGGSTQNLGARAAAALLQGLGVSADEAQAIAKRPLPALEWPATFADG
jgi:AcrR family transcriptional regulator